MESLKVFSPEGGTWVGCLAAADECVGLRPGRFFGADTDFRITETRGPWHFGGSGSPSPGEPYGAKFSEIRDGLSNTIMLAELIAGTGRNDIRGVWAYTSGMYVSGGEPSYRADRIMLAPNGIALDDRRMDRPGRCNSSNLDRQLRCTSGGSRGFQTSPIGLALLLVFSAAGFLLGTGRHSAIPTQSSVVFWKSAMRPAVRPPGCRP